jgi:protein-tyrosine phosphatase
LAFFNFFSKPKPTIDLSKIGIDIHSHLIPAIDDGVKTVEDSLAILRTYRDLGFHTVITTPHVYSELYPNTTEILLKEGEQMKKAIAEAGIDLNFEVSAEYFMDDEFENKLQINDFVPIRGKYLLVEHSFFSAPPKLDEYLFRIQTKGYIPILAHPERYLFYSKKQDYQDFRDKGCLLQVNILSLAGYYGIEVQKRAQLMIKENLVDLIGTDTHGQNHVNALKGAFEQKNFVKIINDYPFKNSALLGNGKR